MMMMMMMMITIEIKAALAKTVTSFKNTYKDVVGNDPLIINAHFHGTYHVRSGRLDAYLPRGIFEAISPTLKAS
jgi:hypothetical protein